MKQRQQHGIGCSQRLAVDDAQSNADTDGIRNQPSRIIGRHHRQQHLRERSVCLILTYHQQRSSRRGRSREGAEHDAENLIKAQGHCDAHDADHCTHRLEYRDQKGWSADFLQRGDLEFIADGKGDEAKCTLCDHTECGQLLRTYEIKNAWSDQYAGNQIRSDIRQMNEPDETRHQKTSRHADGNIE